MLQLSQLAPHIVDVVSLLFPHGYMTHGLMYGGQLLHVQLVYSVDTFLYSYALPIDSTLYTFSSLCLSYNLSQA